MKITQAKVGERKERPNAPRGWDRDPYRRVKVRGFKPGRAGYSGRSVARLPRLARTPSRQASPTTTRWRGDGTMSGDDGALQRVARRLDQVADPRRKDPRHGAIHLGASKDAAGRGHPRRQIEIIGEIATRPILPIFVTMLGAGGPPRRSAFVKQRKPPPPPLVVHRKQRNWS